MANNAPTLSALLKRATLDDHEEVLKAANIALKKTKTDRQAQHARLVALIKLDRYSDALKALEDGGDSLKKQAKVEWAYALYKTGKLDQAENVVSENAVTLSMTHLKAQIAYRAEKFSKAYQLYSKLTRQARGENGDLRINLGAVEAQMSWSGEVDAVQRSKPDRADLEQFDTTFNVACGCIARGQLEQAEVYLRMAKDLCKATDELSESEKKAEIFPIIVQQIYVQCRLGKLQNAEQLCSTIDLSEYCKPFKPIDTRLTHIGLDVQTRRLGMLLT